MIGVALCIVPVSYLLRFVLDNQGIWLGIHLFLLLRAAFLLPHLQKRLLGA